MVCRSQWLVLISLVVCTVLGLLTPCVCEVQSEVLSSVDPRKGTVWVVRTSVFGPSIENSASQWTAVFTVSFPSRPVLTTQEGVVPSPTGLTRLICGHTVIESYPSHAAHNATTPPAFLVPLDHGMPVGAIELLKHSRCVQWQTNELHFAVKLPDTPHQTQKSRLQHARGCRLLFLERSERGLTTDTPSSEYMIGEQAVRGTVRFDDSTKSPPCWHKRNESIVEAGALHTAGNMLTPRALDRYRPCIFRPQDPVFLSTEETDLLGVKGPGGPFMPVIEGLMDPVKEVVGGAIGGFFGGAMGHWVSTVAKNGLSDDISLEITRAMPPQITQQVVPALAETITSQLTSTLSRALSNYLTTSVPLTTLPTLEKHLVTALAQHIPEQVDIEAPRQLAMKVALDLGQTLSRSVPHAIVPALIHSMTHTPLQDYFCYYCNKDKTYCDYCQFSPIQVYYAMYYTGYFSSYHGSYYNGYFHDRQEISLDQAVQKEHDIIAEDQEFEELETA